MHELVTELVLTMAPDPDIGDNRPPGGQLLGFDPSPETSMSSFMGSSMAGVRFLLH